MKKSIVLALVMFSSLAFAQKLKVLDGDIKNLKDITTYNLEFDYTDVQIPKFDSEEDFLADKMAKREEKEAGGGEKFKKSWFGDREERYRPKFTESFNKRFDDGEVSVGVNPDAEYTMMVHSTRIYAGYNVGVVRRNAEIDAIITVFETANPDNVLFKGEYTRAQGEGAMGYDFNTGFRISECYAKTAKTFAKYIKKKAMK
ncbi:hypothetical protein FGM00_15590 [Aggregatimonas sangjinii]|uniref:DUF4410 domain-containing protein n=1 Tax=Aggregatimonas sangjinii TaxID=2583587 RepID=A0A5B7SVX0_9FLAO|nr:hypothetical protein [Aggregatimonas sangjinii]QCX01459.1 hypothetical protein FGM00_15590 [Aggregatimonas sangjinii]